MRKKNTPTEAPPTELEDMLTFEEAARTLNLAKRNLNRLMETGDLGPVKRTPDGQPLLSKVAVLQYKKIDKARRAAGFQKLREATEELGMYEWDATKWPPNLQ